MEMFKEAGLPDGEHHLFYLKVYLKKALHIRSKRIQNPLNLVTVKELFPADHASVFPRVWQRQSTKKVFAP